MNYGLLSLLAIIVSIFVGFFRKINTGLIAITMAVLLGVAAGVDQRTIISGWSVTLTMMLMGVTFLFSISSTNGTLELFARKVIALSGRRTWGIPMIMFLLSAFLAMIGPGTVPIMCLVVPLSCVLASELEISPVKLAPFVILGAAGGGISPIAPTAIIGIELAAKQGYTGIAAPYFFDSMLSQSLYAVVLYFVLRCYAIKAKHETGFQNIPPFDTRQKVTLAGIGIMVLIVIATRYNVGLVSFVVGVVLLLMKVGDQQKAISGMPWGTIILVCGVGVLMNLSIKLKGIELLAEFLASFMNRETSSPIIAATAGVMSWFSSTSGVVMPTLIPTVSSLAEKVPGVVPLDLIAAITNTAHCAGISPASTGGALAIATFAANAHISSEEQNKLFIHMFLVAAGGVVCLSLFAWLGLYRIWY